MLAPTGDGFPPELVAAVRRQAEEDAIAVGEYLVERGHSPTSVESTGQFSPDVLLGIGLALRFRSWELQHVRLHLDAGLPSGTELLELVTTPQSNDIELARDIISIAVRRIQLLHESFLWSLPDESLRGDLAIVADSDEAFLDAVSDFLIEHLQRGS